MMQAIRVRQGLWCHHSHLLGLQSRQASWCQEMSLSYWPFPWSFLGLSFYVCKMDKFVSLKTWSEFGWKSVTWEVECKGTR